MTIKNNIIIKLGEKEIDYGLMYAALSRVSKFKFIRLKDRISVNRLCRATKYYSKIEGRTKEENHLKVLCMQTLKYFN